MMRLSAIVAAQIASEYTTAINAERYQMLVENCAFTQPGDRAFSSADTRCAYCKVQSHGSHCPSCGAPK